MGRTPVDVAGECDPDDPTVFIELEWRRADPADNAVKLFRHLDGTEAGSEVRVFQLFTRYYDLSSGGVSSKRENAEFVGDLAADTLERVTYHPLTLDVEPPKRGGELPDDWETAVESAADAVAGRL